MSEAWSENPEAFETHFGLSYGDFHVLLQVLPPDVKKKYERTLAVDEEAGIIFAIHKGRKLDLLKDDEEESPTEKEGKILQEMEKAGADLKKMPFRVFEHGTHGWYFAIAANSKREAIAGADEKQPFVVQEAPTTKRAGRVVYEENIEGLPAIPYALLSRWPIPVGGVR